MSVARFMAEGGRHAGPVLVASPRGRAVVSAIAATNAGVEIVDRGAYVRVRVRGRCVVTREAIEAELGAAFELPRDLEALMPSFEGRITFGAGEVTWEALSTTTPAAEQEPT